MFIRADFSLELHKPIRNIGVVLLVVLEPKWIVLRPYDVHREDVEYWAVIEVRRVDQFIARDL